jgi:hypothetical protein
MSQRKSPHDGVVEDSGILEASFPDAPPPPPQGHRPVGQVLSSGEVGVRVRDKSCPRVAHCANPDPDLTLILSLNLTLTPP